MMENLKLNEQFSAYPVDSGEIMTDFSFLTLFLDLYLFTYLYLLKVYKFSHFRSFLEAFFYKLYLKKLFL